jgi:RNA-directed DNA polymerase
MLNELDNELERRGYKFVPYADDLVVWCKSKLGAERVLSSIIRFIEEKLFFKVNREKSQLASHNKVKFLGYSFYKSKWEGRLRHAPQKCSKDESPHKGADIAEQRTE